MDTGLKVKNDMRNLRGENRKPNANSMSILFSVDDYSSIETEISFIFANARLGRLSTTEGVDQTDDRLIGHGKQPCDRSRI